MKLWLLVMIGCILPAINTALLCYECSTLSDGNGCRTPEEKFLKTCGGNVTAKSCIKNWGKIDGKEFVGRGCVPWEENVGCTQIAQNNVNITSCVCNQDKCNGSPIPIFPNKAAISLFPNKATFLFMFIVILAAVFKS